MRIARAAGHEFRRAADVNGAAALSFEHITPQKNQKLNDMPVPSFQRNILERLCDVLAGEARLTTSLPPKPHPLRPWQHEI